MVRGKIEIRKIENPTNRQVTYSKRRFGIMKKATELSVLCDAEVFVIMFSSTGKIAEYCSPSTNAKNIMDRYQEETGIDLWKDQYERMQNTLRGLKEVNHKLRKEIRQRIGEDLDGMSVQELRVLEQNLNDTLLHVRQRKYHVITTQTETYKKKLRSTHEAHKSLLRELELTDEKNHYAFTTEDVIDSTENDGAHMCKVQEQPNQPSLQGFGYWSHDLSLT